MSLNIVHQSQAMHHFSFISIIYCFWGDKRSKKYLRVEIFVLPVLFCWGSLTIALFRSNPPSSLLPSPTRAYHKNREDQHPTMGGHVGWKGFADEEKGRKKKPSSQLVGRYAFPSPSVRREPPFYQFHCLIMIRKRAYKFSFLH